MQAFDLNLRHLRAVAATADRGSISGAATAVNLSQPAVTQAVAKVEAILGTPLFERRPSGMAATQAGRLLSARVEAAERALARGFGELRRAGTGRTGLGAREKLLTATQLRALLALAAAGSYVAAAAATGVSQPSLHRAIRDLERLCGAPLVERRARGIRISDAGLRLVRSFRLAAAELEAGLHEVASLRGEASGRVRVGAMPLARARLLPVAAARFHRTHPAVSVEIAEGTHAELIERLRDGTLDFLVGAMRDPALGPDVEQAPLFEDRLMIVGRAGHPLAGPTAPDPAALAGYPWVVAREGTPLRAQWEAMFARAGLPPAPVTCGSVMAIRALLAEGDFLTLLSPEQVRVELAAGTLAGIGPPFDATRRVIGTTTRAGWSPSPPQAAFLQAVRDLAAAPTLPQNQ